MRGQRPNSNGFAIAILGESDGRYRFRLKGDWRGTDRRFRLRRSEGKEF